MAEDTVEKLIPLEEVNRTVLELCDELTAAKVDLGDALGCVLAGDVLAPRDLPPFANAAMDGYAVRAQDTASVPLELEVVGVLPAGQAPSESVGPGTAIKIMTGAPIPDGADSIVTVELTEPGSTLNKVRILRQARPGEYIRLAGGDLRGGDIALLDGTVIGPAQTSLLASVDAIRVTVHPKPRVGVLSTGDELIGGTAPLGPGQIRDSNRQGLLAMLQRDGFVGVDMGVCKDDRALVSSAIRNGIEQCDAMLTTGGVSMGEFDFVKVALRDLVAERGGEIRQLKIAIKPAKPLSFAVVPAEGRRAVPVFGLPGNPVSSLVSYQLFALPALRKMAGWRSPLQRRLPAIAADDFKRRPDGKLHLLRVIAAMGPEGRIIVRSAGPQGSHQLKALAESNALALIRDGTGVLAGESLQILLLGLLE